MLDPDLDPDPDSMNPNPKHWPLLLSLYWLVNQVHFSLMTANVKAKALRATFSPFRFLKKRFRQAPPPPPPPPPSPPSPTLNPSYEAVYTPRPRYKTRDPDFPR